MDTFDHREMESKWRNKWTEVKLNEVDIHAAKKPFYNLMMFPYPSAEGMHVGNFYAFTAADIYGRFKRMQGYDVFEPIGLDGFGIHSENFALKIGRHPAEHARITEKNYYKQLRLAGYMYDWTKTLETYHPDYYKWTQWLFVQMFKAGLAYRSASWVNWCPNCKTVLADEQVIDGACERCGSQTQKKKLEQWFFRITKYSQRLLDNIPNLDWSEKVKISQTNWIGRSQGSRIAFKLAESAGVIEVFTTRSDTLHGATFLALAVDHPQLTELITANKAQEIAAFAKELAVSTERVTKDKRGIFTGVEVINPATGQAIPVWVVNYVASDYGTGAIMGVPAHDERDREFATKYKIDIVQMEPDPTMSKYGQPAVTYHLRDWLISRQRYWGPPIPMIHCATCAASSKGERSDMPGWYTVPEQELPVELPEIADYQPEGEGKGPLAKHPEFFEVKCPSCGSPAIRETDVSDTFLDSAWYFLRYPSVGNDQQAWDPTLTQKWLPVDMYTGGVEHANLHLMYTRFLTMAMHDLGYLEFEEPFKKFFAHGMIIKDGAKMSKSKGNVVNPDDYIEKYGADALRLYMMFLGPVDQGGDFRDSGMEGMRRFVNRLYREVSQTSPDSNPRLARRLNQLVVKVTTDIERRHYNTAISSMMEFLNLVQQEEAHMTSEQSGMFLALLAPFAPHLAEELFQAIRGQGEFISIHTQAWPQASAEKLGDEDQVIVVQVNGIMRDKLVVSSNYSTDQSRVEQSALASAKVQGYINGAKVRTIFVPKKIINFVTK